MPTEIEVRTDEHITTQDTETADVDDVMELNAWPEEKAVPTEPVTVAVMDSGVHADAVDSHPWFDGVPVTKRYDATQRHENDGDDVGHGTGVASLVSRLSAGYMDGAGDTRPVELWDVRIFGSEGRTDFETIERAYEFMIDRADEIDIVNMSWGASKNVPEINSLHEKLVAAGIHDVAAAGNTGSDGGSPATALKAFSAGAVDADGDPTRFTSRDPDRKNPDVAAVGKNVKMARAPGTSMDTPLDDQFTKASGTSFAAPITTAAYVVAMQRNGRSWDAAFKRSALNIPGTPADGEGILKLASALEGDESEERPVTAAATWGLSGNDVVWMNWDHLPKNLDTTAELLDEQKEYADIRIWK